MRVGLFIPCYIDQFFPRVGLATVDVLEHFGISPEFPKAQTCCGQPMANTGCVAETRPLAQRFYSIFNEFDYVVCPSGSCVAMVRHHYAEYFDDTAALQSLQNKTYELCEFLHDVLDVQELPGRFPHQVGIHQSCHGLRELELAGSSERMRSVPDKVRSILELIRDISFVELSRPDECCGFGGTFSVGEEAVSCMMGIDRIRDHEQAGTEVLTSADMSCLMHLGGLIQRSGGPMSIKHVAEVLAESLRS